MKQVSVSQLENAYIDACDTEIEAFKPGNVSIHSEGHGMTVDDFRRSARVSASYLVDDKLSLGEKIYFAIEATQVEVGCNTNLGIVLLAAPLMEAVQGHSFCSNLQNAVAAVLGNTTRSDAEWVYRAIRLAKPGGLGEADKEDVQSTPNVSLTEAMGLASERDRIAYQYVNGYKDIFNYAIKRYHNSLNRWGGPSWAAVSVFIYLLKRIPDSHIVRKYGDQYSRMIVERMSVLEGEFSVADRPESLIKRLREVDAEFKSLGINPGTTADLTVACVLSVNLELLFYT